MAGRRGPRREGDARADIVSAARDQFAEHGYDRASLRGIARAAGVDPALVHHYFDGKAGLFAATVELPIDPADVVAEVVDGTPEGVGERLVTAFLATWDEPRMAGRARALLSATLSSTAGPAPLRGFIVAEVLGRLTDSLQVDEPQRRAGLVGTHLVGLLIARYVLELPGVADAPAARLAADIGPTVQRYLDAPLAVTAD